MCCSFRSKIWMAKRKQETLRLLWVPKQAPTLPALLNVGTTLTFKSFTPQVSGQPLASEWQWGLRRKCGTVRIYRGRTRGKGKQRSSLFWVLSERSIHLLESSAICWSWEILSFKNFYELQYSVSIISIHGMLSLCSCCAKNLPYLTPPLRETSAAYVAFPIVRMRNGDWETFAHLPGTQN